MAVCLLAAAFFIWLDDSPLRHLWLPAPRSEHDQQVQDFKRYHAKTFKVVEIVDGDTIDIDVPDGRYNCTRIRLWGIDAPETNDPNRGVIYFGPQAAEFTGELARSKQVQVYLDEDNRTRGKYGRLLAYVKLPDGRFLNEVLLCEGLAYADLRFRHSLYHKYEQLQAGARRKQKGLWENVTREQLPPWLQRERPDLLR
jgi:endonuclease YncB( thermonuclease family)